MWRDWLRKAGEHAEARGAIAVSDIIQIVTGLGTLAYMLWQWGTSAIYAPFVAILTAFVAYMTVRIAMEPSVIPALLARVRGPNGAPERNDGNHPASPTHRSHGSKWPRLPEQMARLLLIEDAIERFDEDMKQASSVRDALQTFYTTPVQERPDKSTVRSAMDQWVSALRSIDYIASQCYGLNLNVSQSYRERFAQHPIPPHLGLSPSSEAEYLTFFDQLTLLDADGRNLGSRLQSERKKLRADILMVAQMDELRAG